ncbi:Slp family outer membrane lipoprotein [Catenovulum agarivorans DS-2]|uniref:Slp family outer membrane lipoprotein n=1 Tax=Catenovulum agarivorans DS-2 TaxID=1328313 RepID=W7QNX4_9ALTE|nr:Slp/YeaY family lipoprotein [Catenovulum agarivorans]EWH09608.1 Slp family outer membrane lipoprotein [Catenovulum agarivorans DS-2]
MLLLNKSLAKVVTSISLLVGLAACSTVPENLRVADNVRLVNYDQANKQAQAVVGEQARWGGVIVAVKNLPKQTMLELVHYDAYSSSKPKVTDKSKGRFRVYVEQFLEPGIYKSGRLVSALGTISKPEQGKVGDYEISYPVLKQAQVYIWPEAKETDNRADLWRDPFWPYSSRWYWQRYHYLHPYYIPVDKRKRTRTKKSSTRD